MISFCFRFSVFQRSGKLLFYTPTYPLFPRCKSPKQGISAVVSLGVWFGLGRQRRGRPGGGAVVAVSPLGWPDPYVGR